MKQSAPKTPIDLDWVKERSTPDSVTGCWNWNGRIGKNGYGSASRRGDAHRVVGKLMFGEISRRQLVTHTCDNKRCVSPEHLRLGTYTSNIDEAYARAQRQPRRTPPEVVAKRQARYERICAYLAQGLLHKQVAEIEGLSRSFVTDIVQAGGRK
jgi:hypothetical protein